MALGQKHQHYQAPGKVQILECWSSQLSTESDPLLGKMAEESTATVPPESTSVSKLTSPPTQRLPSENLANNSWPNFICSSLNTTAKGFIAVLLKPNPSVVKFFFNVIHTIFIPHCYYDCGRGIATVHFMLPSNASGTLFRGVLKKLNISTKQGEAIKT